MSIVSINNKLALDDYEIKSATKEQLIEAIKESQTQIEHMGAIVDGLLEAARIDNGDFKLTKSEFDLVGVVKDIVRQNKQRAKSKSIQLTFSTKSKSQILINADKTKLSETVSNFIDNAIKYSHASTEIEVAVSKIKDSVRVEVRDQGPGVSDQEKELLFKKFGRANTSKESNPGGLGLGLFLAQKTIEAHKGTLIFESEKGKGSTFGFELMIN